MSEAGGPQRRLAFVALAAGLSRRYPGADKLTVCLDGEPLVVRCLNSLVAAARALPADVVATSVHAVVPDHDGPVAGLIVATSLPVALIANPARQGGIGTSVARAAAVLVDDQIGRAHV